MNGFTVYLCIGKWGGLWIGKDGPWVLRIVLGWVSFCVGFWDMERDMAELLVALKISDSKIKALQEGR